MKYERQTPYNVDAEDVLIELLEYMEDREDADHDGETFVANEEMKLAISIRQLLWQMEVAELRASKPIVHPSGMSPAAFKSMVSRNNMTPDSVEALRGSLERGRK